MAKRTLRTLFQLADGEDLPTEFRMFRAGENTSTKGPVWFTERSAELIMAEAKKHKADYMIDLEHRAVIPRRIDPDRSDTNAQGYFRPEVRDGELWAVSVDWTDEGATRLRNRTQRYTSPAFNVEEDEEGREVVTYLYNCALCAMPATHDIEPLVASELEGVDASSESEYGHEDMKLRTDREVMATALKALEGDEPDVEAARSALQDGLADEEGEKAEEMAEDGDEEKPEEMAEGEPESAEDMPEEPVDSFSDDARELLEFTESSDLPGAVIAFAERVRTFTGAPTLADAVKLLSSSFTQLRALHEAERRELVTQLVSLGVETPATAWADDKLTARLASEPLDDLKARVRIFSAAKRTDAIAPPTAPEEGLSEAARKRADSIKDPEHRARFIALCKQTPSNFGSK